jgi:hypothetical protein
MSLPSIDWKTGRRKGRDKKKGLEADQASSEEKDNAISSSKPRSISHFGPDLQTHFDTNRDAAVAVARRATGSGNGREEAEGCRWNAFPSFGLQTRAAPATRRAAATIREHPAKSPKT